jgi:dihydroorotate dehydrogenase
MIAWFYKNALKPLLFQFDPDLVHTIFVKAGIICGDVPFLERIISGIYGRPNCHPTIIVDGIRYHGPVLLSAGFDYNAHLSHILFSMGFAGEEVGSVTARPCPGNHPPRLRRLIKSRSIQVYKGLKNDGVDAIIERIKNKNIPKGFVLGISIAKTNDQQNCSQEEGIKDYCYSFRRLNEEAVGDFYTINISCPNAFGGEDFAKPEALELLLKKIKAIPCYKPIYIKMPINKDWDCFKDLLCVIDRLGFQGVVIGNLNKNYQDADFPEEATKEFRGGLSGKPCQKLANQLIKSTRDQYPAMTIMGCGGVLTSEDAMEKLKLGANLVQLITGMIFTGPHLMNEINHSYECCNNFKR